MKKIILVTFLSLLFVNKVFPFAFALTGTTTVCGGTVQTYTFTGFPIGATSITLGVIQVAGGSVESDPAPYSSFTVPWSNHSCAGEVASIDVSNISY